jgi:hypothetical protein
MFYRPSVTCCSGSESCLYSDISRSIVLYVSDQSVVYEWVIHDLLGSRNSVTAMLTLATSVCVCVMEEVWRFERKYVTSRSRPWLLPWLLFESRYCKQKSLSPFLWLDRKDQAVDVAWRHRHVTLYQWADMSFTTVRFMRQTYASVQYAIAVP